MREHHILSLSGGKDSTALAFFMKDNMPEIFEKMELVFFDTECELAETYDYLNKIEVFLRKKIIRMKPQYGFDYLFKVHKFLPSIKFRWCTIEMKTKTFDNYMQEKIKNNPNAKINLYIGIRADEPSRIENYKNKSKESKEKKNPNLITHYPLYDGGIIKKDVYDILEQTGIGIPDYYKWRSRSGCYFCFFQKKIEWINLLEKHPDLYEKAMQYEKLGGKNFTWCQDMSLEELKQPHVVADFKERYRKKLEKTKPKKIKLIDIFDEFSEKNKCLSFCFDNIDN